MIKELIGMNAKDKCIPFVSEYSDCNEENMCSGCKNCLCVGNGQWQCEDVKDCGGSEQYRVLDEDSIDDALAYIERGMENEIREERERQKKDSKSPLVPPPRSKGEDSLIGDDFFANNDSNIDYELMRILTRKRRSVAIKDTNKTKDNIKFYHTVDEINEDILKNDNRSGTIEVKKFENLPKASRRVGVSDNDSKRVELSEPKPYETHINENKIDGTGHSDDKFMNQDKINVLITNHTVKQKDTELSKLIVNELKNGSEFIGDRHAPIMSNITFTSENDTLNAMAFIAGNLLNQLWDMEKDSSEETKDIEDLKHEKIANLLDLFKEPLNIRQENFLKSALEHLSVAIDKDKVLKNVSLCEKVEESRKKIEEQMESVEDLTTETITTVQATTEAKVKETSKPKDFASSKAISKIAEVLNLMEKFQTVHKALNSLKQSDEGNIKPRVSRKKYKSKTDLTHDETDSLNVFGKLLEKITKLLLPRKKSKKVVKAIKNHNLFVKSNNVAQTFKEKFGIDIGNATLTAKDKIILDYLNTVKSQPDCLFHNVKDETKSFSNVEGDILLNLSEFFKIKSFMDLMKVLKPEKETARSVTQIQTTIPDVVTTTSTTTSETTYTTHSTKLAETKERLKDHIKSIIEDLRELQIAKGFPVGKISLADTLPCIFNLLKGGNEAQEKVSKQVISPVEKVSSIFASLKKDLFSVPPTRRTNVITEPRPKSAVVWERVVKNFDMKRKQMTRRTMDNKEPKSFDELKKMMTALEKSSKTYKNKILTKGVKPTSRLELLKTLREETRQYIDVLESIKESFPSLKRLSVDKQNDLKDFIYNAATNMILNEKVLKNVNKYEGDGGRNIKDDVEIIPSKREKARKEQSVKSQPMRSVDASASNKSLKLTRDQIINQLIKNRMEVYISIKEAKKADLNNDINYAIAKKILNYLELGNYELARDLYKLIIKQKEQTTERLQEYTTVSSTSRSYYGFPKEPLLQFEEPTTKWNLNSRDSWLKQLANLKRM